MIEPTARAAALARLGATEQQLRLTIGELESGPAAAGAGNGLPAFVLQTLLETNEKQDARLLAFARRTATDGTWSDAVRGQALLLVAKLGGKDELDQLYRFLDAPSPLLQARAMQAIATLQARVAATAGH